MITLTFPVREWTATHTWAARQPEETVFTFQMRGGTCVSVSPTCDDNFTMLPYYRRASLTTPVAPLKSNPVLYHPDRVLRAW